MNRLLVLLTGFLAISSFTKAQESDELENKDALKHMIELREFPGNQNVFGRYSREMEHYRIQSPHQLTANWNYVDASGNLNGDIGRTASVTVDTINTGRFYVCTPHSGVWRTDNNGITYTPITESLPTQSTHCLVIDPSNTNTLYLGTGTFQMDMPRNSMGVFKSTDGGSSWFPTALSFSPADGHAVSDLIVNPQNTSSLLAATTAGLYRTYDGGVTWNLILSDVLHSVRFKPGDTTVIYTCGLQLYRSVDSGNSFGSFSFGITNNFQWHYVNYVRTVRNYPDIVYFMCSGGWNNPTFHPVMYIMKSTDSGNIYLPLDSLVGEACPQIDVSQIYPDKFIAGYRNTFRKEGTAFPFVQFSQWANPGSGVFVHADQRGLFFHPKNDSITYYCNDGGLYRCQDDGNTIDNISTNMQLAHLYNFADGDNSPYQILVSPLDVYPYIIGSSGITNTFTQMVESFAVHMSPLNDSIFNMAMYSPALTVNNGNSFYYSTHPLIGNGFMSTEGFQYDACNENTCYFSSYNDIFKSTDYGVTFGMFKQTTYNPVNSFIRNPEGFIVSRANPRYVYVYYIDSVYVSKGPGENFVNITAGLPSGIAAFSAMVVDPANEQNAWIGLSGYSSGEKIYFTNDAGQTWTNISAGLPNVPVNALVFQEGIPGAVYAGTDGGVFYKDNTFSSWQYYNTGLPNVMITDLEIHDNSQKLRVATFGRGVWESDLFQPTPANYILPPVALFSAPVTHACPNENVSFVNESCGIVDSVNWIFTGAVPASSSLNNPVVSYTTPGLYSVTLIAYNNGGTDTLTLTDYIEITSATALPYYEPVADLNAFVLPAGAYTTEVNFDGANWNRGWWTDGSSGTDDDFLWYDNYFHDLNGQEERLVFPVFDLSATTNPKLFFYRSYQQRDAINPDTLIIYVKPCGGNETPAYTKGGSQLANIPGYYDTNYWIPYFTYQWEQDSVDLTPFAGQSVTISFSDKGYGGQMLYIDEFRVMETNSTGIAEIYSPSSLAVYPNPAKEQLFVSSEKELFTPVRIYDISGRILMSLEPGKRDFRIDLRSLASGMYFIKANGMVNKFEKQQE